MNIKIKVFCLSTQNFSLTFASPIASVHPSSSYLFFTPGGSFKSNRSNSTRANLPTRGPPIKTKARDKFLLQLLQFCSRLSFLRNMFAAMKLIFIVAPTGSKCERKTQCRPCFFFHRNTQQDKYPLASNYFMTACWSQMVEGTEKGEKNQTTIKCLARDKIYCLNRKKKKSATEMSNGEKLSKQKLKNEPASHHAELLLLLFRGFHCWWLVAVVFVHSISRWLCLQFIIVRLATSNGR